MITIKTPLFNEYGSWESQAEELCKAGKISEPTQLDWEEYTDEYGNRACEYCQDIKNCTECENCVACSDCEHCAVCRDCENCMSCKSCLACENCGHCVNCVCFNGLKDCKDLCFEDDDDYCGFEDDDYCSKCEYCERRADCKDCVDCKKRKRCADCEHRKEREIAFLKGEIKRVESILNDFPEDMIFDRNGFEARLEELRKEQGATGTNHPFWNTDK